MAHPADGEDDPRRLQFRADVRQMAEPGKKVAADGINPVCFQLKAEVLGEIVEPRIPPD